MKIFIASEFKCTIYKDEYYLAPKAFEIYHRYANAFGDVVLCSRFSATKTLNEGYKKADFIIDRIEIADLMAVLMGKYNDEMSKKIKECQLVIARVPSIIAYTAAKIAHNNSIPYLGECMGEAWDSYWNHGDLAGKFIAPYMEHRLKQVMQEADFAVYVTDNYLQHRYPTNCRSINASNVFIREVNEEVLERRLLKIQKMDVTDISLMTSASVEAVAKGHRYVIEALSLLARKGIKAKYYIAGGGDITRLKKIAEKYNVQDQVIFLGELSMRKLFDVLESIDIYIQPSLQEGLPRAVIEAMSLGCPCLGSNTAGTPELIPEKYIFNRRSARAIANSIIKLLEEDMTEVAVMNFYKSREYLAEKLNSRRNKYFLTIKNTLEGKKIL